ncbi:hypothetical protein DL546_000221 [Coniochaeta pulveracea]|uniref:RecA family profile 1 domain-containing protein n=1 Tax=Coniochaeta pulveracea TaxID=177199 RepID=A0A420XYY1_9PEZI|nr:hypothetical protein DL546_000221 [Coniochaeta pulveracea]
MTDLLRVLPDFPIKRYPDLLPALEKHNVTTTDLLTLDVADIGKRTQLPLLNLRKFCDAVLAALHGELSAIDQKDATSQAKNKDVSHHGHPLRQTFQSLSSRWQTISTLDSELDTLLSGGIPTGSITEITGESGTGKTQLLLSLLLAVQLPPPHGLGRPALYISTEAPLSTKRLTQMLTHNRILSSTSYSEKPSLDNISSITIQDLESQDHILTFQVPVEVARRNIGLIVLDSVAANYRAEFERSNAAFNMGARSAELVRLVVANQVADRFDSGYRTPTVHPTQATGIRGGTGTGGDRFTAGTQDSPLAMRSTQRFMQLPNVEPSSSMPGPMSSLPDDFTQPNMPPSSGAAQQPPSHPALLLDHQQRWFTGWGDDPYDHTPQKTPSLGLVWTTQIASRIALYKRPAYGRSKYRIDDDVGAAGMPTLKTWRRWFKVVFAPHVGVQKVEFEIGMGGLKTIQRKEKDEEK